MRKKEQYGRGGKVGNKAMTASQDNLEKKPRKLLARKIIATDSPDDNGKNRGKRSTRASLAEEYKKQDNRWPKSKTTRSRKRKASDVEDKPAKKRKVEPIAQQEQVKQEIEIKPDPAPTIEIKPQPMQPQHNKQEKLAAREAENQQKEADKQIREEKCWKNAKADLRVALIALRNDGMYLNKFFDITVQFQTGFRQMELYGPYYQPRHLLHLIGQLSDVAHVEHKATLYNHCYSAIEKILVSVTKVLVLEQGTYKKPNILEPGDLLPEDDVKEENIDDTVSVDENEEDDEEKQQEIIIAPELIPALSQPMSKASKITEQFLWLMLPTTALRRQFVLGTEYEVLVRAINRLDIPCIKFLISGTRVTEREFAENHTEYGNDLKIAEALVAKIVSVVSSPQAIGNENGREKLPVICSWYIFFTPQTTTFLSSAITKYLKQYCRQHEGNHTWLVDRFTEISKVNFHVPRFRRAPVGDNRSNIEDVATENKENYWDLTLKEKHVGFNPSNTQSLGSQ